MGCDQSSSVDDPVNDDLKQPKDQDREEREEKEPSTLSFDKNEQKLVWIDSDSAIGTNIHEEKHGPHGLPDDSAPVIDDAFAILAILNSPRTKVVGISSTYGNDHEAYTYPSLKKLLDIYFKDNEDARVPLLHGAVEPLKLFSGYTSFSSKNENKLKFEANEAVEYMYNNFKKISEQNNNKKITILTLGPFTNVALLLMYYPDVKQYINEIVCCKGRSSINEQFNCGSGSDARGFPDLNYELDPLAANIVLQSNCRIILAGFNIGSYCWMYNEDFENLQKNAQEGSLLKWITADEQIHERVFEVWNSKGFGNEVAPWPTKPEPTKIHGMYIFDMMTAAYLYAPEYLDIKNVKASLVLKKEGTENNKKGDIKYSLIGTKKTNYI